MYEEGGVNIIQSIIIIIIPLLSIGKEVIIILKHNASSLHQHDDKRKSEKQRGEREEVVHVAKGPAQTPRVTTPSLTDI